MLARLYQRRGMTQEARKRYQVAAVLDGSISDADDVMRSWLDGDSFEKPATAGEVPALPAQLAANGSGDASPQEVTREEMEAAMRDVFDAEPIDDAERPQVTFNDIGGMLDVIDRIRMNIIQPFKKPELFRRFNKKAGGGILMYGPPGCGKTHIARATAGECGATFTSIAITDILSKWIGESERHLHDLFEIARRRSPTVIFIDEIDAIGASRADAGVHMAPLVNVLLTEMDGIASRNDNIMVLAATNTPWRIDSALRRPGRFDRVLFVPPPDAEARTAILNICLRNLPVDVLDVPKIARMTDRYSGADLRAVVERAAELAIQLEMRSGRPSVITQRMLLEAVKETRASTGEWLETARSYATYANKAGLYDDLVRYFEAA
jgi:SpoVK/Ycf46/Vps4 family AAA+-type ATPase